MHLFLMLSLFLFYVWFHFLKTLNIDPHFCLHITECHLEFHPNFLVPTLQLKHIVFGPNINCQIILGLNVMWIMIIMWWMWFNWSIAWGLITFHLFEGDGVYCHITVLDSCNPLCSPMEVLLNFWSPTESHKRETHIQQKITGKQQMNQITNYRSTEIFTKAMRRTDFIFLSYCSISAVWHN